MKRGSVAVGFLDDHHWSACFGLSLRTLYLHDQAVSQRIMREGAIELRKVAGTGGIPEGRNEVARQFLDETDREWLWMVDTDMGFAKDTVDRLVGAADEHKRPVVGGLCFANRRVGPGPLGAERFGMVPTLYDYVERADQVGFSPWPDYPPDELVRVAGTGAACMVIHRRALRKVREKFGDGWFNPMAHPTGIKGKPRTFSEDLSFCVRLGACDLPLYVHTGVKTTHEKGGIFLDEGTWEDQRDLARYRAERAAQEAPASSSDSSDTSAA